MKPETLIKYLNHSIKFNQKIIDELKESILSKSYETQITKSQILKWPTEWIKKKENWWETEYFYKNYIGNVYPLNFEIVRQLSLGLKLLIQPATEEEIFRFLKKQSIKRFGKIKTGDEFESVNPGVGYTVVPDEKGKYQYDKQTNRFWHTGVLLFDNGKWATKQNRNKSSLSTVFIENGDLSWNGGTSFLKLKFGITNLSSDEDHLKRIGKFLSEQLAEYLNGEKK